MPVGLRPKNRRRSIVADGDFTFSKDESDFSLLPLLDKKNVSKITKVRKCVKKIKKEENLSRKPPKKRKNCKKDEKSLPSALEAFTAELNDIENNYVLHETKDSANRSSKSENKSITDKSEQFFANTMQIGTSTPSMYGRPDRKPCLEAEVSKIENFCMSPVFENSRTSIEPEHHRTNHDESEHHRTPLKCPGLDDLFMETDYHTGRDDTEPEHQTNVLRLKPDHPLIVANRQSPEHHLIITPDQSSIVSNQRPSCRSSIISNRHQSSIVIGPYQRSIVIDHPISIIVDQQESIATDRTSSEDLFKSASEHRSEQEDRLADLINELSVDKLKISMNATKQTVQSTKSYSRLSFSNICSPYFMKAKKSFEKFDPRSVVFQACGQEDGPLTWNHAIPDEMMQKLSKIGEGTYGEVFKAENLDGESVALKVIPIEGNFKVNDEPQKSFEEILPEILIATEMSNLQHNEVNNTPNFVEVKNIYCIEGGYPDELLMAWDEFNAKRKSENDRPDMFDDQQLFIVFEFGDGGTDLENFHFQSTEQAKSVVIQLTLTLAVAEKVLQFEHRDLHIGNVLVKKTDEKFIEYVYDGYNLKAESHGVHVYVIDFTNSRLHKENVTIFTNLANDEALFEGQGDYQFEVYRLMRQINGDEWKHFEPKSNILWLHYLIDKLCKVKKYRGKMMSAKVKSLLNSFADDLLKHPSCEDFVLRNDFDFFNEVFNVSE